MKTSFKTVVCFLLVCVLTMLPLAGCSDETDSAETSAASSSSVQPSPDPTSDELAESAPEPSVETEDSSEEKESIQTASQDGKSGITTMENGTAVYPLDTDVELTFFMEYTGMTPDIMPGNADNFVLQLAEERTGIHVVYKDISSTAFDEQLSLMIASGDYTDMIENLPASYTRGLDEAVEQDVIIDLRKYRDYAPNYFYIVDQNDTIQKDVTTDSGVVGAFYKLQAAMAAPKTGVHIRADWLEEQGLADPVTVDDYTHVFEVFQNAYDPEYTFWLDSSTASNFAYAYDVVGGDGAEGADLFFQKDGVVKYSPVEDGYKEYVKQLHEWYEAGYINSDFISLDSSTFGTSDLTKALGAGEVGVVFANADVPSQITSAVDGYDVAESFKPLQGVVRHEGDVLHLGTVMDVVDTRGSCISATCSDVEAAMRWFDYWYTEEGSILYTYGEEGTTFNWNEDHQALFTDLITDDPNYPAFFMEMAYLQDSAFGLLYAYREGCIYGYDSPVVQTPTVWRGDNYDGAYVLTDKLSLTSLEAEEYSSKYVDIETFVSENVARFITGDSSMDDFDAFVDTIYDMGIEDVLAIKQAAYDRYLKR